MPIIVCSNCLKVIQKPDDKKDTSIIFDVCSNCYQDDTETDELVETIEE